MGSRQSWLIYCTLICVWCKLIGQQETAWYVVVVVVVGKLDLTCSRRTLEVHKYWVRFCSHVEAFSIHVLLFLLRGEQIQRQVFAALRQKVFFLFSNC